MPPEDGSKPVGCDAPRPTTEDHPRATVDSTRSRARWEGSPPPGGGRPRGQAGGTRRPGVRSTLRARCADASRHGTARAATRCPGSPPTDSRASCGRGVGVPSAPRRVPPVGRAPSRSGIPTEVVGIRRRVRIPIHAVNRRSAGRPGRRAAPDPARALPRLRTPCLLCCIRRKWSDIVQGARRRAARPGRARRDARPDIPTRRDDALRPRHMARPMAGRLLNAGDRGKAAGPVCRLPRPPFLVARPDAA